MSGGSTEQISGWFTAAIATVVATLSSVVAFLFKLRENENAKRIEDLSVKADQCVEERTQLKTECAIMRGKIEVLETKISFIDTSGIQKRLGDA